MRAFRPLFRRSAHERRQNTIVIFRTGAIALNTSLLPPFPRSVLVVSSCRWYSWGSRLASELGGVAEKVWGAMTLSGDENSLRCVVRARGSCLGVGGEGTRAMGSLRRLIFAQ